MSYIFLLYFLVPSFFSPSNPLPFQSFRRRRSLIGTASAASASIQPAGLPPPFPPAAEEKRKKENSTFSSLPFTALPPPTQKKERGKNGPVRQHPISFLSLPPFLFCLRPDPVIKPERRRARNQGDLTANQGKGEGKGQKLFSSKSFSLFSFCCYTKKFFIVGLLYVPVHSAPPTFPRVLSHSPPPPPIPPPSSSYVNARVRNDCSSLPLFPLLHPPILFLRPKGK